MTDDFFQEPSPKRVLMRWMLLREADDKGARFGIGRRGFLGSSMGAVAAVAIVDQAPAFASTAEAADGFRGPSENRYAEVCERAQFRSLEGSSAADWDAIAGATRVQQPAVQETVLNMMRNLQGVHAGFLVDQDIHCTQTATRALRDNASDELVLCSLIHDVAKVISNANHPELVAAIARPYVSDDGYRILRHHMEFQWKHYGGHIGLPTTLRERYEGTSWYAAAAKFSDDYDQRSFDPDYDTLPLAEFEPLVREFFGKEPQRRSRTADDCL